MPNSAFRNPLILPDAGPFFFPGGPVGCLLVHGFTGTPKEMRWMGEYLAGQGYTVLGIRLAAHATDPQDMARVRWRDWLASMEDGWHLLQESTRRIYVMGLSMGGILSLVLASRFPVAGVISMSTPYALPPDPRLPYVRWLSWLVPTQKSGAGVFCNPEAAQDHIHYPDYPTRVVAELGGLLEMMRQSLPQVTAPALLVHSRLDCDPSSFDPASMQHIYERLGSADKQMLWVENSGHVIPREPDRHLVFERVHQFVQRLEAEVHAPPPERQP